MKLELNNLVLDLIQGISANSLNNADLFGKNMSLIFHLQYSPPMISMKIDFGKCKEREAKLMFMQSVLTSQLAKNSQPWV